MKRIILLTLLVSGLTSAQLITWQPYFVKDSDSIDVYFDATQGNKGLLNYTGDVYAHTGVLTNLSATTDSWRYVLTNWGVNTPATKLDRLGPNYYHFKISPSIKTFYGVPSAEQITNVCFVFRSADAAHQTSNIFLPLFGSGLNVALVSPSHTYGFSSFQKLNDTIKISAVSSHSTNLSLYVDNNLIVQTADSSLNTNYIVSTSGKKWVKAVATGQSGTAVDSFYYVVNSPVPVQSKPDTIDGIHYTSPNTVTLTLYAPHKKNVYVLGDFNNWEIDPAYAMNVSPDSLRWWIQITGLTSQKEYVFQYLVDGNIRIGDPYSEKIVDPFYDQYISSSTYPNLIAYPIGKTSEIATVIQPGQTTYNWQISNFSRPDKTNLVIYELLIRDFLAAHNYKTLTDTLNYLKNLGINAIELMPVMEFEGNDSWGYNPSFHMALDKYYGPKNDLKAFVDKAHSMGIAVILDIVLNHVMGSSPLARLYWDTVNNRPDTTNPWLNPVPKHDFNVGNDINHESPATQYYVDRVTSWWLTEYNVDGFRFDLSKGFTQTNTLGNTNQMAIYDQSRVNILTRMSTKIWQVKPGAYVILEHFAEDREEDTLSAHGMMLWGNMNNAYLQSAMGYSDQADISRTSYLSRKFTQPNLVSYMESHDEERMMYKNITYGNSNGTYNIKDLHTALNRVKLAAAFFYTIPGPKMLWMFGELGYDITHDNYGRVGDMPIKWDYYSDPYRKNVYKVIAALTALKQNAIFTSNNFTMDVAGLWKRINIPYFYMNATIIGNFNVVAASGNPNFQSTGTWYDYFTGDTITVTNTTNPVTLRPGEFHIYTTVKFPTPELGIVEDVSDNSPELVKSFKLFQNYPNPFNPSTEIKYQVFNTSKVVIKIYDVLGNEIKTLVNEEEHSGTFNVTWNGDNNSGKKITSGVYFCRMESGSFVRTIKLMMMK
jgi:1,4-alpha-glucan branching enzyme